MTREGTDNLSEAIQACFREAGAGRNLRVPEIDECEIIADSVSRHAAEMDAILDPAPFGDTARDARRLVSHLPTMRQIIRSRLSAAETAGAETEPLTEDLVNIALAERSITLLLDRYGAVKPRVRQWHDIAVLIQLWGSRGWGDSIFPVVMPYQPGDDDPRVPPLQLGPTAVNPGDPLCQFVTKVLARMGIWKSESAVSDALRLRRGPATREGKTLAPKCP